MSAHRPVHGHRVVPDDRGLECQSCGLAICEVANTTSLTPHWRHKGTGYRWGDVAAYWKKRALDAERRLAEG